MAEEQKSLPKIRTFETDIEIRKKIGVSPVDMVAKTGIYPNGQKQMGSKKILIIFVSIIIAGGSAFGLFKYFSSEKIFEETPKSPQIGEQYIKADLEKTLSVSANNPGSLILEIKKELETQRKSGSVLFLNLPQTLREFSQFTSFKIPESLLQNSNPSFNIFSVYHTGSSSIIFLIKTENFEKAYGSMLSWEKDIWQSFSQFLNGEDIRNIKQFFFKDEIIRNHDSRILTNTENKSILAYAIFNKQFVIVSTSREALSIMLQRLIASPPK